MTNGISRRDAVQKLMAAMAAGGVAPMVASSHPIFGYLTKAGAELERADAARAAADWRPVFLNAAQNDELIALAEAILPGSTGAQVNRFLDLLLSVDTPENQKEFTDGLGAVEDEAKKRFGRGFAVLNDSERVQLLTVFSEDKEHIKQFESLKEWISGAYYSSEQGMRELGWNGNFAFDSYPACEHTEKHS